MSVKIIQFHNFDRILFGTHFVFSILLAGIVNFARPSLTSSDTDKFKFPNMVSDKSPSRLFLCCHTASRQPMLFSWPSYFGGLRKARQLQATFWYIDNFFIVWIILPVQSECADLCLWRSSPYSFISLFCSWEWAVCFVLMQEITLAYQTTGTTQWTVKGLNSAFSEIKKS